MLEVGNPPGGTGEAPSFENVHSWRAHFGAWLINSSPLILSFDLTNLTKLNLTWDFITNQDALKINSDYAGEAGRLLYSVYDQTAPTPVFARPCSHTVDAQRFVFDEPTGQLQSASKTDRRCISVPGCPPSYATATSSSPSPPSPSPPVLDDLMGRHGSVVKLSRLGNGGIKLAPCTGASSQQWNLTGLEPSVVTDVQSLSGNHGCWEIDGCGGSTIDTNYGCKKLPTGKRPWKGCNNMAWTFATNGTIISGIAGANGVPQCLQVSPKDESTVTVGPCTAAKRAQWRLNGTEIRSAFGGCIDNHATQPANPQYGPLVVAPCELSQCGGKDHSWRLHPTTKQLISAVPGMGEKICMEAQGYGNHYSSLSGVGCADPGDAPIPQNQRFSIEAKTQRVTVDTRFNQTLTGRAVGMLLCADIDFSAPQNGQAVPGSRTIAQVFAKRVAHGAVAVLFLNADTNLTQDLSVDLTELELQPSNWASVVVRDIWEKADAGTIHRGETGGNFTAHGIPPQDSKLLLFTPKASTGQGATTVLSRGFSFVPSKARH